MLLMVIEGAIQIESDILQKRDEVQLVDKEKYTLKTMQNTYLLLFEVPMSR